MFYPLRRLFSRRTGDADREPQPPADTFTPPLQSPAAEAAAAILARSTPGAVVPGEAGDVMSRIHAAMEEVRPAIRMDGGDIELIRFQDGVATVKFKGACRSCPMAEVTLQLGVERVLREMVPEVERVEAV